MIIKYPRKHMTYMAQGHLAVRGLRMRLAPPGCATPRAPSPQRKGPPERLFLLVRSQTFLPTGQSLLTRNSTQHRRGSSSERTLKNS